MNLQKIQTFFGSRLFTAAASVIFALTTAANVFAAGGRIVYSGSIGTPSDASKAVFIMNADGTGVRQMSSDAAGLPNFDTEPELS